MKKQGTLKKLGLATKILLHITFVVFALIAVAGPILLGNNSVINSVLGIETQIGIGGSNGDMYFDTEFENMEQVRNKSLEIIEETMSEGAVLLKNGDVTIDGKTAAALPLAEGDKVTLYGAASYHSVFSGQGSSGIESTKSFNGRVHFYDGLSAAGLDVDSELNDWYKSKPESDFVSISANGSNKAFVGGSSQESQYTMRDINWSELPDAKFGAAKAAIVVFARNSGEAEDLYMDTAMHEDGSRTVVDKNNHNNTSNNSGDGLALTTNEISLLTNLKKLKDEKKIGEIVVIMNSAAPLQCAFTENPDYGVAACLWVGTLGTNGATAIGKILTGKVNPSGKMTDTIFADSGYNPVYYNFGSRRYGNYGALSNNYFATMGMQNHQYYAVYQEGIYMGYKYTETRYEDVLTGRAKAGEFVYKDAVSYPFGYGLSYSRFTYSNMNVAENKDDTYTVTVDVTNTSDRVGKESVQVYLQKPYTQKDIDNGVEKASVELIGFTKVEVPANSSVTATVTVEGKYFAAYDANAEKTYVVGSDNAEDKYLLTAAQDAHDAVNNILRYKNVDASKLVSFDGRGNGNASLVWGKHIPYIAEKYSTNEFIENENKDFTPAYEGQQANYGVSKITNQFDDTDFKKAGIFSANEQAQVYMSRNDWTGTIGKRITLTANDKLALAQRNPAVAQDDIPYPTMGESGFYTENNNFDEIKLIYLRGKDFDDPLWETLLDRITWEEYCALLQQGFRVTNPVESIAAPGSSQQNGAIAPNHSRAYGELNKQSGFQGFVEIKDKEHRDQLPPIFLSNGVVAATYDIDLIKRLGKQTGEEAAWAGYNGIYGLGVNIHRGLYCGRQFEYYSEDGFLTGVAAGYEAAGLHEMGVFVLMKHAVLNDQETHRAGLNVWANEQTIREIYSRAIEIAVEIDRELTPNSVLGVMTGMNRLGAKWTGGQGFCNTVLRAEYGMRGFAVSDYNSSRPYMSPIQGVLYGNDLPDGNPAGSKGGYDYDGNDIRFVNYSSGYGELAWAMRSAAKNLLYTVVNSNTVNGVTGDSSFKVITPAWEKAVPIVTRVSLVLLIWSAVAFAAVFALGIVIDVFKNKKDKTKSGGDNE